MARQDGFSYVAVMFLVAVLSLVATRALRYTQMEEHRSKEAELMATGLAYREAIRDYYQNPLGSNNTYPPSLKALLKDERWTRDRRPLRKLYRDPLTGSTEWGLVFKDGDTTKLIGVYSLSTRKPIKKDGFPEGLQDFSKAATYRDWKFVYRPPAAAEVPIQGAGT